MIEFTGGLQEVKIELVDESVVVVAVGMQIASTDQIYVVSEIVSLEGLYVHTILVLTELWKPDAEWVLESLDLRDKLEAKQMQVHPAGTYK